MKSRIALLFLSLFFWSGSYAQEVYVSPPLDVVSGDFGYQSPRIVLLENGNPLVFWGNPAGIDKMYISAFDGQSFGLPGSNSAWWY